jgi:hypothetical protein
VYLQALFAEQLPIQTEHHLIFTFSRDGSSFGASDDQAVTVASQLDEEAQAEAIRLHGSMTRIEGSCATIEWLSC